MQWQELNENGFYGLESFLSDGTALDIVEYANSQEFCWMIRVPIDDDYTTHEIYASYDEDVYFDNLTDALDDCMSYLQQHFSYLSSEINYEQNRKQEKIRFLQAAAFIGIAAVFSSSLLFGFAAPDMAFADDGNEEVYTVEEATTDDPLMIMYTSKGRYWVEDINDYAPDREQADFASLSQALGIDLSQYVVATGSCHMEGGTLAIEFDDGQSIDIDSEQYPNLLDDIREEYSQAIKYGKPVPDNVPLLYLKVSPDIMYQMTTCYNKLNKPASSISIAHVGSQNAPSHSDDGIPYCLIISIAGIGLSAVLLIASEGFPAFAISGAISIISLINCI